ncbi:MAG: efflux RND transporter periplasmic adaptor subunit [Saccharospirillaceae bacterium]|nr:efflux RND transporter periplasmic adaptor subunit [Saccharospirillaceae bacterium]
MSGVTHPGSARHLLLVFIFLLPLQGYGAEAAEKHDHDHESGHNEALSEPDSAHEHNQNEHNDSESSVRLSAEQRQQAGIISRIIPAEKADIPLRAPAEIRANGYRSFVVSPRVDSVVITRHVALGDHVQPGQPLLTLFSEGVASAQAELRSARSEWLRVKKSRRKGRRGRPL